MVDRIVTENLDKYHRVCLTTKELDILRHVFGLYKENLYDEWGRFLDEDEQRVMDYLESFITDEPEG